MWDWYNRPGQRPPLSTRAALVVMIVGGLVVGALMTLFYFAIAPHVFMR
jgi:hypothetical protein